jgi:hypothetical protein
LTLLVWCWMRLRFMLNLHQVTDRNEVEAIKTAASKDNHYTIAPTHYWTNDTDEIVSYFSAGIVPVCHFWMRRDSKPRDSLSTIKECEKIIKALSPYTSATGQAIIACTVESPFYKVLEKHFGYKQLIVDTTLFTCHV